MASVRFLPDAWDERTSLPTLELNAMNAAIRKLQLFGEQLPFPHQSQVRGIANLRELRPRGGRSPWRAFYRRTGRDEFVIAAIGPEAQANPRKFKRATATAVGRLADLEGQEP
jgi:hypothetical protein